MKTKTIIALALLALAVFLLFGCGANDDKQGKDLPGDESKDISDTGADEVFDTSPDDVQPPTLPG